MTTEHNHHTAGTGGPPLLAYAATGIGSLIVGLAASIGLAAAGIASAPVWWAMGIIVALLVFGAIYWIVLRQPAGQEIQRYQSSRPLLEVHPPRPRSSPPPDADQDESQANAHAQAATPPTPPVPKRLPNPKMVYKGQRRTSRASKPRRANKDTDPDDDHQPAE